MTSKIQGEKERCAGGCGGGGGAAAVVVVEYLESTMSKHLLCKFPDNSAFDFDYSQSSIWSPLLSRNFNDNSTSTNAGGTTTSSCGFQFLVGISSSSFSSSNSCSNGGSSIQRKLSYDDEEGNEGGILLFNNNNIVIFKKLRDKIKRKINTTANVLNNLHIYRNTNMMMMKKKKNRNKTFDLSPFKGLSVSSSYTPTPIKGWRKLLKAASKQFKKKTTNKKNYYYSRSHHHHLHLSN